MINLIRMSSKNYQIVCEKVVKLYIVTLFFYIFVLSCCSVHRKLSVLLNQ